MADELSDPILYTFIGDRPPTRSELADQYTHQFVGHSADGSEQWSTGSSGSTGEIVDGEDRWAAGGISSVGVGARSGEPVQGRGERRPHSQIDDQGATLGDGVVVPTE